MSQGPRRVLRSILASGLFALTAAAGQPKGPPPPNSRGPLVQVSPGPSVFPRAGADDPASQGGTVTFDTEVEPMVAVDPNDPKHVVAAFQQDRWDNGGCRGLVTAASFDGGLTFAVVPIPGTTLTTGGPFQRASDPWLTFAPDGTLHATSLLFSGNVFGLVANAMTASRSTDGGLSWGAPTTLYEQTNTAVFLEDKETITADPLDSNRVYAIWDRANLTVPQQNGGPAIFTRTTDGGASWEPAHVIADYGDANQTIGHQIVVLADGTLVDFYSLTVSLASNPALAHAFGEVLRSHDHGVTWGERSSIGTLFSRSTLTPDGVGVRDPETGAALRAPGFIPVVALDPTNGSLYMVWQDARFSNPTPATSPFDVDPNLLIDEVAFTRSTDAGLTWSAPIKVNQTPASASFLNRQAFLPSIRVAADGTVAVTYYDFRRNTPDPKRLGTDSWAVFYRPGSGSITNPASWGHELRLTNEPFDARRSSLTADGGAASGFFLGDYMGLSSAGNDFFAIFSASHQNDPASAFVRRFRRE